MCGRGYSIAIMSDLRSTDVIQSRDKPPTGYIQQTNKEKTHLSSNALFQLLHVVFHVHHNRRIHLIKQLVPDGRTDRQKAMHEPTVQFAYEYVDSKRPKTFIIICYVKHNLSASEGSANIEYTVCHLTTVKPKTMCSNFHANISTTNGHINTGSSGRGSESNEAT